MADEREILAQVTVYKEDSFTSDGDEKVQIVNYTTECLGHMPMVNLVGILEELLVDLRADLAAGTVD